jgi:TonB family protein
LQKYRCLGAVLLFFVANGGSERCSAQEEQSHVSLTPEQQGGVTAFAQTIQKELKKERCANSSCHVLVVNLTISTGETCSACILLSDSLAKSLAELPNAPGVVSRASLASFMDQERISYVFLNRQDTQVWIARELRADRVVFGSLVPKGDSLQLKARVLKHEHFGDSTETSKEISARFPMGDLTAGLLPRESYHSLPKREPSEAQVLPTSSLPGKVPGGALPACFYMPNPPYSDAARAAKLSGTILVEGIITTDGRVTSPRIIKGLPLGLNESSLDVLQTWRCKPALQNGVPVSVLVPFEVTFRLY